MSDKILAIMQSWDREAGIPERSAADYERDVPGSLGLWDHDEWLTALENDDVAATLEGRRMWGLPALV